MCLSAAHDEQILKRAYLPEEALVWLTEKKPAAEPKEKKPRAPRQPLTKRKATGGRSNGAAKYVASTDRALWAITDSTTKATSHLEKEEG